MPGSRAVSFVRAVAAWKPPMLNFVQVISPSLFFGAVIWISMDLWGFLGDFVWIEGDLLGLFIGSATENDPMSWFDR